MRILGGLFVLAAVVLGGCQQTVVEGGGGDPPPAKRPIGAQCTVAGDCESGECATNVPGGLCVVTNCEACPGGSACRTLGSPMCVKTCGSTADCGRTDLACNGGACVLKCTKPTDCSPEQYCDTNSGECILRPPVVGATCSIDNQCASHICLAGINRCSKGCTSTSECGSTEACVYTPYIAAGGATAYRLACSPNSTGQPTGADCKADKDCATRMCHLGKCTQLCSDVCPNSLTCVSSQHWVLGELKPVSVCLPQSGTLTIDHPMANNGMEEYVPVPKNAVSVEVSLQAATVTPYPLFAEVVAPDKSTVYTAQGDIWTQPLRIYPENQVTTMYLSNAPRTPLQRTGPYKFSATVCDYSDQQNPKCGEVPKAKVFYKLAPNGVAQKGVLNFNVFFANLSGHPCGSANAANGASTLAPMFNTMKGIYAKAGISIGTVNYYDLAGASYASIDTSNEAAMSALFSASASRTNKAINLFFVRTLSPQGVLGVSGGIPGPAYHGTGHSGVVMNWESKCYGVLGNVMSHEVGHYLGLFHNVEQDGHQDAIDDTSTSNQNLMYWNEQGGDDLSVKQGVVMLGNVIVQ